MKVKIMKTKSLILSVVLLLSIWFSAGAQTYLISDGGTVNTCSGTLYDSGGASGSYANNEDYTITICSDSGSPIELEFTTFNTESNYDELTIHDGPITANPVLIVADGSDLLGQTIVSSSNCLTLVFSSDLSGAYSGFAAQISCAMACQNYDVDIIDTDPAITNPDSVWIDLCQGSEVTFTAEGNYPNSGADYLQNDGNVEFSWNITNGDINETFTGVGMTELTYEFVDGGGYFITLTAEDLNGCDNQNFEQMRVRVSMTPSFDGTNLNPLVVCPGDEVNLNGQGFVTPITWHIPIPTEVAGTTYLPDGSGAEYTTSINHGVFNPGQTLDDADDLLAICMNLEHSYMGDLDIWIECPSGEIVYLFEQACGSGWFGEATDGDTGPNPGVGYDYCWTMGGTDEMEDDCPSGGDPLPSGDYLPLEDFSGLEGCDLNGDWTIHVLDNLSIDNGYIFSWQLIFDPSIIPDDLWTFTNSYDDSNNYWTGENIDTDVNGNAIATPTTEGSVDYVFTAVDDFGCTYDTTLTITVLPDDDPSCCSQPTANVDSDDAVCSDTYQLSTDLTLPVNTVEWTQISGSGTADFGGQENSTNPTVTVDTYGVYEFQVSEQNVSPACSDSAVIEIAFYETPTPTFSTTFIACYIDSTTVTYEGNASPTASYNWDFDGGTPVGTGQGPIDVTWSDAGLYTISLTVDQNGCVSDDTTVNVLTPEALTHVLTYEHDLCFNSCGGSAEVNVQGGTLPYTYSWGPNSINEDLCAGDYGITVTDNNGCEVFENFTITEPPELVINSTSTQDLTCFNSDDGEIIVNASGGTGTLVYAWSDGGSGTTRLNMPAGNFGLTITDQNDCSIQEYFTLTQPNELLATISPDQAHCEGQVTTINSTAIGGTEPYTYYWDRGNGFMPDANILSVSPDTTTTYVLYVEDDNGCESPPVSMTLTISPQMYMILTTQDNRCFESCDGEAQLHIDGGIPPFNYSWASDGSVNQNLCSGIYTVTVSDILGCNVDTVFYIDQPTQMFGNIYTRDASCYGYDDGRAIIEVVGGVPGYTYLWPNGSQNDTINLNAGTHEVTVTDAHNCRLNVDAMINEPDQLRAQLVGGSRWICKTNTTQLNAQTIGGTPYYDFYWSGTDGTDYVVRNPEVSPDTTTTYTVTVVDSHACSSNSPTIKVNVYPDLEIEHVSTSYDSICPNNPAIVEVDVSGGNGGPYSLTLQDGQIVPAPFTVYPSETTNYIITLNDACGSPSVQDSIEIIVMPKPGNSFTSDKVEGCPPLNVKFNEVSEDEGQTYLWSFGDNGFAYVKNPRHIYQYGGQYPVTLTVTSEFGCKNTRTIEHMIQIFPKPIADFYTDNNYVSVLDPEVQFFNLSEGADSTYWFFGDGDSSHFENPSHNFTEIGEYEIHLVIESDKGCFDTVQKVINVRDEFTFYAPTAFSPNGDGDNDFFMVYGNGIDKNEFSLIIYDRWGELIFETDIYDLDRPMESAWDGTYNGNRAKGDKLLHNGIYYWYCKFKDYTGVWHEKEGAVSLLR